MLSHGTFSRDISSRELSPPTSRYPPLAIAPLAYAHDVLSHDTASICGTRSPMLCPPSGYPPLSQHTPLLWYRHWLCYAQYVLSPGNASTIGSCSRRVRSLSRYLLSSATPPPARCTLCLGTAPLAYALNVLSPGTASTCATLFFMLRPLSVYPPLLQCTPLLRYCHWLCYAQYLLS